MTAKESASGRRENRRTLDHALRSRVRGDDEGSWSDRRCESVIEGFSRTVRVFLIAIANIVKWMDTERKERWSSSKGGSSDNGPNNIWHAPCVSVVLGDEGHAQFWLRTFLSLRTTDEDTPVF